MTFKSHFKLSFVDNMFSEDFANKMTKPVPLLNVCICSKFLVMECKNLIKLSDPLELYIIHPTACLIFRFHTYKYHLMQNIFYFRKSRPDWENPPPERKSEKKEIRNCCVLYGITKACTPISDYLVTGMDLQTVSEFLQILPQSDAA